MESTTVTGLAIAAIKGTRLREVDAIDLGAGGARGNRSFFVVDERERMVNGKQLGPLQAVLASYDDDARRLALEFPDSSRVEGAVELGAPIVARFSSRQAEGRLVEGPWAEALSDHIGQPLRLVSVGSAVDRGLAGGVSLISRASLERISSEAGVEAVDARRFRMLIEVDGLEPHAEDGWVGRQVRAGEALIGFEGHVGRCLVTSRHPETGEVDLATLDILRGYRGGLDTTEPLAFGIYGRVLEPGSVRVGDAVTPVAL